MIGGMTKMPGMVLLAAVALTACSSGPPSPVSTAASVLAASGAAPEGAAYMVTADIAQGNGAACDAGSAEADGTLDGATVNVCVLPSQAQRDSDEVTAMEAGPAGGGLIAVGGLTLVYVIGGSPAMVAQMAKAAGGTVAVP